ncbi:hypothetical protein [Actinospongicola halichondriae]|uniref:hypothetical protein n=1 Tax=Actinospongicola halichondriae TaxID=3236844 RepID=UPI003D3DBB3B
MTLPPASAVEPRHGRNATVALVASATGIVVPILGPVVGVALGMRTLWSLRDRTPNDASRQAMIAVGIGLGAIAVPIIVVGLVKADDWTFAPLVAALGILSVVLAAALRLGGMGAGAAAATVAGTVAGVSLLAVGAIVAVVAIGWLFVLLVREFFAALFGATIPSVV